MSKASASSLGLYKPWGVSSKRLHSTLGWYHGNVRDGGCCRWRHECIAAQQPQKPHRGERLRRLRPEPCSIAASRDSSDCDMEGKGR